MKYTKGPWEVDLESGEIIADGVVLGMVYGAQGYPCCEEDIDEECKTNARLIAAAPELYEACKLAVDVIKACSEGLIPIATIEILNKAIAKVEGE